MFIEFLLAADFLLFLYNLAIEALAPVLINPNRGKKLLLLVLAVAHVYAMIKFNSL